MKRKFEKQISYGAVIYIIYNITTNISRKIYHLTFKCQCILSTLPNIVDPNVQHKVFCVMRHFVPKNPTYRRPLITSTCADSSTDTQTIQKAHINQSVYDIVSSSGGYGDLFPLELATIQKQIWRTGWLCCDPFSLKLASI